MSDWSEMVAELQREARENERISRELAQQHKQALLAEHQEFLKAMQHPAGCWCHLCFNRGARLGDAARKAKLVDPIGKPQACDEESMTVWFEYHQEPPCKV